MRLHSYSNQLFGDRPDVFVIGKADGKRLEVISVEVADDHGDVTIHAKEPAASSETMPIHEINGLGFKPMLADILAWAIVLCVIISCVASIVAVVGI